MASGRAARSAVRASRPPCSSGYTPTSTGESVSWALEGYINDFGIGNMAAALAKDPATPEIATPATDRGVEYFLERARNYVNMFDPASKFFQGRDAAGTFQVARPARLGWRATPRPTAGTSRSPRNRTRRA